MKKIILSVFILVGVMGSLVAQKPKDIRQKTNAHSIKTTDIKPPLDYREIGVPESNRIFEGTSSIKSISTLLRPSQALPRGFKVISAQDGLPTMIQGSVPDASIRESPLSTRAIQYLDAVKNAMQVKNPFEEFEIKSIETDELGQSHVRMQQKMGTVPVWGSEIILHERGGKLELMNGIYFPTPSVSNLEPTVSKDNAELNVKADLNLKTNFKVLTEESKKQIGGEQLRSELVIFHANEKMDGEKLAWHVTAYPNVLHRYEYFVDAVNGNILNSYTSSCDLVGYFHKHDTKAHLTEEDVNGTENITSHTDGGGANISEVPFLTSMLDGAATANASDLFNLTRVVNTYQVGANYYLIDASRPMYKPSTSTFPNDPVGVIQTLDFRNTDEGPGYFVTSTNNIWSAATKAISAHYNAGKAYEYYRTTYGRNSINGKGGNITSIINVTDEGVQMDNAYWNGEAMFYGNGKDVFTALPKALDVAGHEISHGVVQNTANLMYQGESGALNESFADIFGAMIDRDDWKMGEDIVVDRNTFPSGALRDLSNPHNGAAKGQPAYQPQTYAERYQGTADEGGVHINSGIPNYAYYLFATNVAVGKDKAEKVFYRALSTYLVKSSKFIDLRAAVEQSCKDLYSSETALLTAAQTAFIQVGIGTGGSTTGTTYQTDVPVNAGSDLVVYVSNDNTKLMVSPPNSTQPILLYSGGIYSRPSVTDDGTAIFFIGADKKMRAAVLNKTTNIYAIRDIQTDPIWNNVAISKDGKKIAANFDDRDSIVWVYSYDLSKAQEFVLYNPTTAQGNTGTFNVKYSDALEWDHFGEYVMYDAFNLIPGSQGADVEYWDVGFVNVWSNTTKNFAGGKIEKLFSDLGEDVSIGNPTFAKNSPYIIAFDYIESSFFTGEDYYVMAANIQTGDVTKNQAGIFTNNTLGYPSYSRTDDRLLFTVENAQSVSEIKTISLSANKIEPSTTNVLIKTDAQKGNWFSNGTRVLSSTDDLDKTAVKIAPNPFHDHISIEVSVDKTSAGKVEVFDLMGRNLVTRPLNVVTGKNAISIETNHLQSGAYLVKITVGRKSLTTKMMKM